MTINTNSDLSQVPFVGVKQMVSLVNTLGIKPLLSGLIDYLEQDFKQWQGFDKSPRYAAHSPEGVIELMPTGNHDKFSFKYVNGHPKNTKQGLQTVTAFGVLSDVDTGYPLLLSEMTLLTALRTAATSAMMAKYLAPKGASTMAMIGCGAQSEFQAIAFNHIIGIDTVRLYDVEPEAITKCQHNLKPYDITVIACESAQQAVTGADIITTCTADKKNATILTSDMVKDAVYINAIGGDCPGKTELEDKLLMRANVFVEYEPQTRIEGDIQQLSSDSPITEMHQVITGEKQGRTSQDELIIFDGVGFAVEDYSALRFVYDLVKENNDIQTLDLLANPQDPRNLFGITV
ncbi:MAG: ornithine cyclodeaminase [Psychrobium sp.]